MHGYSKPSQESDEISIIDISMKFSIIYKHQREKKFLDESYESKVVNLEPGPEFKSRFEVLEELGKGRFGIVHKVIDKETSQKLAAKFIKCRNSKDRDKVQEEIDIMNLLRHPKLLQLVAAFDNPKEVIVVTE